MRYSIAILFMLLCSQSFSQENAAAATSLVNKPRVGYFSSSLPAYTADTSFHFYSDTSCISQLHPSYIFKSVKRGICKTLQFVYRDTALPAIVTVLQKPALPVTLKPAFLQLHGNIYYDIFYQSNIDTPFLEKDIYQHTISTYLDATVKGQYPLRVNFTARFSNSGMFRDFNGLGLQFNPQQFKNSIKTRLQAYALQKLAVPKELDSLQALITQKTAELNGLHGYLNGIDTKQQIVEARERAYVERINAARAQVQQPQTPVTVSAVQVKAPAKSVLNKSNAKDHGFAFLDRLKDSLAADSSYKDSLVKHNADTVLHKLEKRYAVNRQKYDSLKTSVNRLQLQYDTAKKVYNAAKEKLAAALHKASPQEIAGQLKSIDIPDTLLPKGYKQLLAVRSVGIGRSLVDYSELSAKNIMINGLQIEYNPSYYVAIATGFIDYQFRDYAVNTAGRPKQYLNIARIGKGMKDGNNVIVTFYQGKKSLHNYYSSVNGVAVQPGYEVAGFTIETRRQVNDNSYIVLEAGKSSMPYFRRVVTKDGLVQSALQFSDHSNEAYAAKFISYVPLTATRINAVYKHSGADFQSFSYYSSSSVQDAWSLKIEQPLFKHKLNFTGSLRKNDFSSPYLNNSYQSNTLFKSVQATLRIKKWPVVSAGYFPTSQVIKFNDELFVENLYYTFIGNISHSFRYRGTQMNTLLTYLRFYNKQADSGFVYFNTKNIMISHNMHFSRFSLGLNASAVKSTDYHLYTMGGHIQCRIKDWLEIGGGIKYNNQTMVNNEQVGYSANTSVKVPKVGTFRFSAEKGFIPAINRQLVENKTGRFTFIKVF